MSDTSRARSMRRPHHTLAELVADIADTPWTTAEEAAGLGRVIRSPETSEEERAAAIRELVRRNLPLVLDVARKMARPCEDIGELVSDGTIGLQRAAAKFDPDAAKFSTYATIWIRQAIGRGRAKSGYNRPFTIPIHVHWHKARAEALRRRMAQEVGGISLAEAAGRLGLDAYAGHLAAMDAVVVQPDWDRGSFGGGDEGGDEDEDIREMADGRSPGEGIERSERDRVLAGMIAKLPPREQTVIRLYYGFDEVPGIRRATGKAASEPGGLVARHLGISRQRALQIRKSAERRIRRMAEEAGCF